jgi:mycothiol synthase
MVASDLRRRGYTLRHPRPSEARDVQSVLDAAETADCGESRCHETSVATEWMDPARHLDADWWVVEFGGNVVAVAWVSPDHEGDAIADHYVHPDHRGLGLGELLLDTIVRRTGELSQDEEREVRRVVVWCEDTDVVRREALERRGWTPAGRRFFEMAADLRSPSSPSSPPSGIDLRRFRPGLDEGPVYAADQEAFAEHFLFTPHSFEEWRLRHLERPGADVALWRLAWDGEELAGFVTAAELDDGGVIGDLAVRRPWRGRGIGRALLGVAFAALRERGQTVVRLYVDERNVTGAVRVYEAAGMHAARHFDVLEKSLP